MIYNSTASAEDLIGNIKTAWNISEMQSLAPNAGDRVRVGFELTVVYVHENQIYVRDKEGMSMLLTGSNDYHAGNVIPSSWIATCSPQNGSPRYTGAMPSSLKSTGFDIPTVSVITAADVNRIVTLEKVVFNEATPVTSTSLFTGVTENNDKFTFRNMFSLGSVTPGSYSVTVAVGVMDDQVILYPTSYIFKSDNYERVSPPVFTPGSCTFRSSLYIELTCETRGAIIFYTLDGSEPTDHSLRYTTPIEINESHTIKAVAYASGMVRSETVTAVYTELHESDLNIKHRKADYLFSDSSSLSSLGLNVPEDGELNIANKVLVNGYVAMKCTTGTGSDDPVIISADGETMLKLYPGNMLYLATMQSNRYTYGIINVIFEGEDIWDITYDGKPLEGGVWTTDELIGISGTIIFNIDKITLIDKIVINYNQSTGMDEVREDTRETDVQYYNLDGIRVLSPVEGIYIRVEGNKAEKIYYKN
ncbi:MAG: chitobiase/beta-hexosaminidase C-terminal domain-containing protein [Muribaculaceae bacterium]|nr:chitobiase/beta-hexosaminidase C-terminal domain-containing protein [Muribaculaceae bacterium]